MRAAPMTNMAGASFFGEFQCGELRGSCENDEREGRSCERAQSCFICRDRRDNAEGDDADCNWQTR